MKSLGSLIKRGRLRPFSNIASPVSKHSRSDELYRIIEMRAEFLLVNALEGVDKHPLPTYVRVFCTDSSCPAHTGMHKVARQYLSACLQFIPLPSDYPVIRLPS